MPPHLFTAKEPPCWWDSGAQQPKGHMEGKGQLSRSPKSPFLKQNVCHKGKKHQEGCRHPPSPAGFGSSRGSWGSRQYHLWGGGAFVNSSLQGEAKMS